MIKKTRINFIIVVCICLLFIFALLYLAFCLIVNNRAVSFIGDQLKEVSTYYQDNASSFRQDTLILQITGENYTIINTSKEFNDSVIQDLFDNSKLLASGQVDGFYYTTSVISQKSFLFALDQNEYLDYLRDMRIYALIVLIVGYLLATAITLGCSSKILEPMNQTVFKQKQFISDAGHELKTPLTIISASADVLSNSVDSKYLNSIKTQTKRMDYLIKDMLMLARLDEEKYLTVKEEFSLTNAINESVLPFEEVAFESGKMIITDVTEGINYYGDRESIIKIMGILVDNAIKYSVKGSNIKITLKQQGAKNVITVYNDGSGVKKEDTEKIFERFYRGDYARTNDGERGGSGLGLAIAKGLCENNGWDISAKSELNEYMLIKLVI